MHQVSPPNWADIAARVTRGRVAETQQRAVNLDDFDSWFPDGSFDDEMTLAGNLMAIATRVAAAA